MKSTVWTALLEVWGRVYLRFTDPERKLLDLRKKLRRNRDVQKRIIQGAFSLASRRKLSYLIDGAASLRKQIVELERR